VPSGDKRRIAWFMKIKEVGVLMVAYEEPEAYLP